MNWVVWLVGAIAISGVSYGFYKIIQSAIGSIKADRGKVTGKEEWELINDVDPPQYQGDVPGEIW